MKTLLALRQSVVRRLAIRLKPWHIVPSLPQAATSCMTVSTTTSTTLHHHRPPPLVNYDIDPHDTSYRQAVERTASQVSQLEDRLYQVRQGGGSAAVERHLKRQKLLPRDRMERLVDPGTTILELSALAGCHWDTNTDDDANGNQNIHVPSGGIVTAIGVVANTPCMMIANDATVKGGTYFPITVKKHLRAQEIAWENNLPCIYLVDSGGAYLPQQVRHWEMLFFLCVPCVLNVGLSSATSCAMPLGFQNYTYLSCLIPLSCRSQQYCHRTEGRLS